MSSTTRSAATRPTSGGTNRLRQHIWGEDGQNLGPFAQHQNVNALSSPAWWGYVAGGVDPAGYPNLPAGFNPCGYLLPRLTRIFNSANCTPYRLQSFTSGGLQVLMVDGSVRTVSPSVSQQTWANAVQPDDGQPLGSDW